ncbi:MAG: hypothetical protein H0U71_07855 [Gammaproteobacteria bacterium]|nr:hypothetical protein [Gammaproteobacteria bacterium]
MKSKCLLLLMLLLLVTPSFAGTLFITAKERGHGQVLHMQYVHVADFGWNSAGDFIIRFENGEQQSLGRRSQWEYFAAPIFVNDNDQLRK